ncbi:succinylglutamate desuccinylase/aspartoacylase family protein [Halalkalicoccus ordinarius]|uniref:succinylglutamate desuccinylase/aspartoacylase family protein n=1 Tax=Halalkalicoccus ordinarius TaxID=3116651 RepID=UPI00300F70AC
MTLPFVSRRRLLTSIGSGTLGALAGCIDDSGASGGTDGSNDTDDANDSTNESSGLDRETYAIMEGTEYETDVHVLDAGAGPTGMVLGGVHGNEVGGIEAARLVPDYGLSAGRLVVIPEANAPAVETREREGPDGNLNRQFPVGEEPTTEIARALWDELERHDPDCLIDMHTSRGVYRLHSGSVGQAIFPARTDGSVEDAEVAAEYANGYLKERLDGDLEGYEFVVIDLEGQDDIAQSDEADTMLVHKAGADLETVGWITEVTYRGLDVDEQRFLHDRLAVRLLAENGLDVESPLDDGPNPL